LAEIIHLLTPQQQQQQSQASSNQETSVANVLRSFLSVKDKLDMLKEQFSEDSFGKQYVALAGNFNSALTALGVSEYTATVGEPLDRARYLAVEEEYNTGHEKNTVLRPLRMGLELKGNVVRLAEVVGSLGEEMEEEEEKETVQEAAGETQEGE
jgi:molecular chaperone GrpE (heat shock protein)